MTQADFLLRAFRFAALVLGLLNGPPLAYATSALPVVAANEITTPDNRSATVEPEQRPIHFKQESKPSAAAEFKPFGIVALFALISVTAALWLKRKRPALLARLGGSGGRIKVIETRMVTTRLSLNLIEFDGKELLLAASGDNVIQLQTGAPFTASAEPPAYVPASAK